MVLSATEKIKTRKVAKKCICVSMGDCIPGRIKSKPALDQEHQGRVPEAEMLVTENSRE